MNKITIQVVWCERNYSGSFVSEDFGVVVATGSTLEEFKSDFEEAMAFHIEGMVEDGDVVPQWAAEGQYEIIYELHISAILREASKYTTMAAISRVSGINNKLLEHYAACRKQPRAKQQEKIMEALHTIGKELLALT